MLSVTIFINDQPLLARSVVNTGKKNEKGETIYHCDDGTEIAHHYDEGAVPLAIKALQTIQEYKRE